jgi:2-dehydropantoate 2-reductase
MPVSVLKLAIKLPLPVTAFLLKPLLKDETQESSTLQSIKRGRPVETGYLNGEIVRMAEENNMEAPVNARVMEIIGEVSQSKSFLSTSDLAGRFKEFF